MSESPDASTGKLIYLMGASGSGKDTLLQAVDRIRGVEHRLLVAQRYITRQSRENCEGHIALSDHEFMLRERDGKFLFNWQAHGNHYAVGVQVLDKLREGMHVLMNGSRRYLQTARGIYPDLIPVSLEVEPAVLRDRLTARGRENATQISARLQSAHDHAHSIPEGTLRIHNNGRIEAAVSQLLECLDLQIASNGIEPAKPGT